jgi:hypothetical protein
LEEKKGGVMRNIEPTPIVFTVIVALTVVLVAFIIILLQARVPTPEQPWRKWTAEEEARYELAITLSAIQVKKDLAAEGTLFLYGKCPGCSLPIDLIVTDGFCTGCPYCALLFCACEGVLSMGLPAVMPLNAAETKITEE